jgi:nitrite reductase/ring-hydroxylating ferredoxin subunit
LSEAAASTDRPTADRASAGPVLCRLADIEDGQAKGFTLGEGAEAREIFVAREDDRVFGYLNSCPHLGTPLNMQDDRFISDDSGLILCTTHGALFEIEDGACVSGPCAGQALEAVAVAVDAEGRVVLTGD